MGEARDARALTVRLDENRAPSSRPEAEFFSQGFLAG
jgi:hypothetical protein